MSKFELRDKVLINGSADTYEVMTNEFLNTYVKKACYVLERAGGGQDIYYLEDMKLAPIEYTPAQVRELRGVRDECVAAAHDGNTIARPHAPFSRFVKKLEERAEYRRQESEL